MVTETGHSDSVPLFQVQLERGLFLMMDYLFASVHVCDNTGDDINIMPFTTLLSAQIAEW